MARGSKFYSSHPAPSTGAINSSVARGLRIDSNLGPLTAPFFTFSPSLGIAAKRIDKLSIDIRSWREPFTRSIRQVMMPSIRENFNVGGRPPWAPLSESTWEVRSRFGWEGGTALALTGALMRGASSFKMWTITTTNATIRAFPENIWYGRIHQEGYGGNGGGGGMHAIVEKHGGNVGAALREVVGKAQAGGSSGRSVSAIPQRQFLMFQPEDEMAIHEIFVEWMDERVRAAWPSV